jgi:hypothetical protein
MQKSIYKFNAKCYFLNFSRLLPEQRAESFEDVFAADKEMLSTFGQVHQGKIDSLKQLNMRFEEQGTSGKDTQTEKSYSYL